MAYRLTKEEKEIENNSDNLKSISKEKRNKVLSIIERARKGHAISLRLSEFDLEKSRVRRTTISNINKYSLT
jgi:hypothetical protein